MPPSPLVMEYNNNNNNDNYKNNNTSLAYEHSETTHWREKVSLLSVFITKLELQCTEPLCVTQEFYEFRSRGQHSRFSLSSQRYLEHSVVSINIR